MPTDVAAETRLRFAVKKELRKRMRGLRATMPRASIVARSEAIVERASALSAFLGATGVALFAPMEGRNEVDLLPLAATARAAGKRVAYPFVDTETGGMLLRFVDDEATLIVGPMGALEPPPTAPLVSAGEVGLVLVPALAIDEGGHRIGYGGGFYDRMLPVYAPPAVSVGVAFEFQLLCEIPSTEGDVAVSHVVTDERSFAAGSREAVRELGEATFESSAGVRTVARRRGPV